MRRTKAVLLLESGSRRVLGWFPSVASAAAHLGILRNNLSAKITAGKMYKTTIPILDDGRPIWAQCPCCSRWSNVREYTNGKCRNCLLEKRK